MPPERTGGTMQAAAQILQFQPPQQHCLDQALLELRSQGYQVGKVKLLPLGTTVASSEQRHGYYFSTNSCWKDGRQYIFQITLLKSGDDWGATWNTLPYT